MRTVVALALLLAAGTASSADVWDAGVWDAAVWDAGVWDEDAPGSVAVPDVTALDVTEADTALEAEGLDTGVVTAVCSAEAENEVVRQRPEPGVLVASGSLVDLDDSSGMACPAGTGNQRDNGLGLGLGRQ